MLVLFEPRNAEFRDASFRVGAVYICTSGAPLEVSSGASLSLGTRNNEVPGRGSSTDTSAPLNHRFPLQRETMKGRHQVCWPFTV